MANNARSRKDQNRATTPRRKHLHSKKKVSRQRGEWLDKSPESNLEIRYEPVSNNVVRAGLSRWQDFVIGAGT